MTNLSPSGILREVEWKDDIQPDRKGGPICYTDGSKANKVTGAGMYGYATKQKSLASALDDAPHYSRPKCMSPTASMV
jgi:hypothetical protein